MKITLSEAMQLKNRIVDELNYNKRMIYRKREFISDNRKEVDNLNPKDLVKELEKYFELTSQNQKDLRDLTELINNANNTTMIETDEGDMSIAKSLNYAKQLREKSRMYDELSHLEDFEITTEYGSSVVMYKRAVMDPQECREKSVELNKRAQKISTQIESKNNEVELSFKPAKNYL